MSMLAVDLSEVADPAGIDDARPARPRSPRRSVAQAPLWAHALALAVVLLVGLALTRPSWPSISDEGAALSQVDQLVHGDGWLAEHPYPAVDPEGTAFPIDLSSRKAETDQYAPLAKHPLYASLLRLPYDRGGVPATFAVSVVGTVLAAVAAALLGRRIAPGVDRTALWLTGVATPLFYDSYLLIAHTLGAACVGFAALLLLRRLDRPLRARGGIAILGGLTLLVVAELLRNEAVLLGVALSVALLVVSARRGASRGGAILGAVVLAVTAAGYRLDAYIQGLAMGEEAAAPFSIARSGDVITERWLGFVNATMRLPDDATARMLVASAALLAIVAASRCRRVDVPKHVGLLFGAAGLCSAGAFVASPGAMVGGLVFAAPVLVVGWVMLDGESLRRPLPAALAITGALFALAVFATQYADAGNAWGGRYLAIALPLVAPLAAAGLLRGYARVARPARLASTVGIALMVVALAATAVTSIYHQHVYAASVQSLMVEATTDANGRPIAPGDGDPRPVVVATERAFGRLLWPRVRQERWLTVLVDDTAQMAERLHATGVKRLVVLTSDPARVREQVASWYVAEGGSRQVEMTFPLGHDIVLGPTVLVLTSR